LWKPTGTSDLRLRSYAAGNGLYLKQSLADLSPIVLPEAPAYGTPHVLFQPGQSVVALQGRRFRLVDVRGGKTLADLPDVNAWVSSTLAGPILVIHESEHGRLCLVDQTGTVRRTDVAFDPAIRTIAVGPDGNHAAVSLDDSGGRSRLLLVDLPSGKLKSPLQVPLANVIWKVVFSPDGSRLAGACTDGTVRLWDTATWLETRPLRGHAGHVLCVAFAPDGRRLASGSVDDTVRQWDVDSGCLLDVRQGHFQTDSASIVGGSLPSAADLPCCGRLRPRRTRACCGTTATFIR
jgi:WD40 repeat protein